MANIVGTSFRDFIHRAGDGFVAGAGDNEIATVTVEADTIDAGIGDDFIHADAGNDSIITGAGADLVLAAAGADTVSGGDGVDTIRGGQGADSLSGGVGNDLFLIETASDIDGLAESIDGGTDFDELNFTNFNAFGPIDLSAATITGIERLANSEVGGGHASAFLGGDGFTGVAGQLRYSPGKLLGDIDGDSVAEFQIALAGAPVVTGSDLIP